MNWGCAALLQDLRANLSGQWRPVRERPEGETRRRGSADARGWRVVIGRMSRMEAHAAQKEAKDAYQQKRGNVGGNIEGR